MRWPDEARLNAKRAADATRSLGSMTKRNEKAPKARNQADKSGGVSHDVSVTDPSPKISRKRMTGQERRQQLLDIGRRLFAERGFEGTSIEEIAAQAGVSKPVVYEHFGGKEGLYAVVVDREVERLTTVTMLLFQGPHSKPKFEAAAVSLLRYIEENADGFRILVRDSKPRIRRRHLRHAARRHRGPGGVHHGRLPEVPRPRSRSWPRCTRR